EGTRNIRSEELCQRCVSCKLLVRMDHLKLLNAKSRNPAQDRCASRLKLVAFATAILSQRKEPGRVFNTRGSLDMRSPELLTRSATESLDGHRVSESASAGTVDTAAIATRAAAATLLRVKSRFKCPVSPTTAATPNS